MPINKENSSMTTSTSKRNDTSKALAASGEHWFEMTATITRNAKAVACFDQWMDEQLAAIEIELKAFVRKDSNGKFGR
jgi:hypothetical protein